MEHSKDTSIFGLPYEGKYVKNDMKFDFNKLPFKLKHILYRFLNIHLKSIKENKLSNTRNK
jgi:hypothetical protein